MAHLTEVTPELKRVLTRGDLPKPQYAVSDIRLDTVQVVMRDGIRLATDLYLPPQGSAPVVVMRTPYGRAHDLALGAFLAFARRGYAVVSQDCRGTGDSEPDRWDYYVYETEDSIDCIDWVTKQGWYGGFIGSCGSSYVGQTQWCMALHPAMSATVPQVSGLGIAWNSTHLYMFLNAYARTVGKGEEKQDISMYEMERHFEKETMAGGFFNEPLYRPLPRSILEHFPNLRGLPPSGAQRWLWEHYCGLNCARRAVFLKEVLGVRNVSAMDVEGLSALFGHRIAHDALTIPHASSPDLCRLIHAPPLLLTGWYDWGLNDALATWQPFRREAKPEIAGRARMIIGPHAHNMPGYHEEVDKHQELMRLPSVTNFAALLLRWYETVREGATDAWPTVLYYLMGANEWCAASDWPVPQAKPTAFYLGTGGALTTQPPTSPSEPARYTYNPLDPTPTVGGSILSYLYPPGSVDVSAVQGRPDILVYTTPRLERDLDVVGPLHLVFYAASSAPDTDFIARLSDVFPDGRAIQIQSGILRARYHKEGGEPELLEPGRIYRFEIDMWATANRFKVGHCLRVDISSADFPHFDRNSNCGGEPGDPISAHQTIYHDPQHHSHLLVQVLTDSG